jgi:hypothetical protein
MMTGGMKEAKMTLGARGVLGLALLMATAGAAQAECLSAKCSNQITIFLFMVAGFVLLAIVILVMLIRPNWRKEGVVLLALSVAVFAGIPLASQGWMAFKQSAMERREILGQPPAMTDRTPLVIVSELGCEVGPCKSVLRGRAAAGAYVVTRKSLDRLDLTKPVALAHLPLEFQSFIPLGGQHVSRFLTEAERREAALQIDYVILVGPVLDGYRRDPKKLNTVGAIDHLLRGNPALADQTEREFVQLAMAPIDPGLGTLSFADLKFDLLELWFFGNSLAIPLSPDHWNQIDNREVTAVAAATSLCPVVDGEQDWFCANVLQ